MQTHDELCCGGTLQASTSWAAADNITLQSLFADWSQDHPSPGDWVQVPDGAGLEGVVVAAGLAGETGAGLAGAEGHCASDSPPRQARHLRVHTSGELAARC